MILGQLRPHDHVLVRSRIQTAFEDGGILFVPSRRGEILLDVGLGDMYRPPSTDALYQALRSLQQEISQGNDRVASILAQAMAEVNELGGHALTRQDLPTIQIKNPP